MKRILLLLCFFVALQSQAQIPRVLEFDVEVLTDSLSFKPSKLYVDQWADASPVNGVAMIKVWTRLVQTTENATLGTFETTVRTSADLLPKSEFEKCISARDKITGAVTINTVEFNKVLTLFKLKLK